MSRLAEEILKILINAREKEETEKIKIYVCADVLMEKFKKSSSKVSKAVTTLSKFYDIEKIIILTFDKKNKRVKKISAFRLKE